MVNIPTNNCVPYPFTPYVNVPPEQPSSLPLTQNQQGSANAIQGPFGAPLVSSPELFALNPQARLMSCTSSLDTVYEFGDLRAYTAYTTAAPDRICLSGKYYQVTHENVASIGYAATQLQTAVLNRPLTNEERLAILEPLQVMAVYGHANNALTQTYIASQKAVEAGKIETVMGSGFLDAWQGGKDVALYVTKGVEKILTEGNKTLQIALIAAIIVGGYLLTKK